jgi:hypothetical protein
MKRDLLAESTKFSGEVLLHDEDESGNLASVWLTPTLVHTPQELFGTVCVCV